MSVCSSERFSFRAEVKFEKVSGTAAAPVLLQLIVHSTMFIAKISRRLARAGGQGFRSMFFPTNLCLCSDYYLINKPINLMQEVYLADFTNFVL